MDTPASLSSKRIGCIGCGNMGGAILGGLAEVPGLELYGYNRTPQRLEPLCAKGVTAVPDIPGIAARCDILVIGVKPYLVGGVLAEALPSLKPETVVISIAAGVTLHDLRDAVQGRCHVVRVMPNTPALVGAGVFGIQEDPALPKDVFAMILDLFGLLGSTIVLPEKKFNAFMALVGCGPAYVFHFMDALAEAGVTMGFTRQEALELVTQLVLGSAKLAALPGSHPAILREQVCSPAGVTTSIAPPCAVTSLTRYLPPTQRVSPERKRFPIPRWREKRPGGTFFETFTRRTAVPQTPAERVSP